MNKIGFFLSGIFSILGIWLYVMTRFINLILPKIGYAAFQVAKKGSYSSANYVINFSMINKIAAGITIIGIILSLIFYIAELKEA